MSAGRGGLRRPPQLHLQIRRQVQQVGGAAPAGGGVGAAAAVLKTPLCVPLRYFIFHKPNKTWQQVFWLSISIAINNAYVLYKMSDAYAARRYSRAQFGETLVRELLELEEEEEEHAPRP